MSSTDLKLRCTCGKMQGVARSVHTRRIHLVCYCRDCQAFAHFLERPELLDAHGGTEVCQVTAARVELHEGRDRLACMRLSPEGVMRWYSSCCRTPLFNLLAKPKLSFVGLISAAWDPELDAAGREALLGPVRARVNGPGHADANGTLPKVDKFPIGVILHWMLMTLGGQLRGEYQPTLFWDLETGKPSVEPHVITLEERQALMRAVG